MRHFLHHTLLIVILALGLSACATTGQDTAARPSPSPSATPDAAKLGAAVTEKEKAIWEALKNKQYDDARKLWADDYTGVYDVAIRNVAQELEDVRKLELTSYTLAEVKTTIPNRETAIITYKATVKAKYQGKDISGTSNVASVWRERNGDWQTILHTDMPAK